MSRGRFKVKKILFIFVVLSMIISLATPNVTLAQDLTQNIIKDIKIENDKTTFTNRDRVKITVDFDASGRMIEPGDMMLVQLPDELKGFETSMNLSNADGKVLGSCNVTTSNITCTFNENVKDLTNIKGQFYFTAEFNDDEQGTKQKNLNFGNTAITKSITVDNPVYGEAGVSNETFYKGGQILPDAPNQVSWAIRFNNKQDYFRQGDPAMITDKLGEGQAYDVDSFQFTVTTKGQSTISLSKADFEAQYGEVYINKDSFNIRFNQPNYTQLMVYYNTKIDDSSLDEFSNGATTNYIDKNGVQQNEVSNATVKNISAGGNIEGELAKYNGKLTINKVGVDKEGNKTPLAGAKFSLTNKAEEVVAEGTTDDNGQLSFNEIKGGTYSVKEIVFPDGYKADVSGDTQEIVLDFKNQKEVIHEITNIKEELEPATEAPTTEAPTTEAPTTEATTTEAPTTEAPTTEAPTTEAPTTEAPTTEAPTMEVPTTEASTTEAPTTEAPTTEAPTTEAPTTEVPTTEVPTTEAPTTEAPTTEAPTTEAPTTEAPTTEAPTTEAPTTEVPTTEAPTTEAPTTEVPTTEAPTTEAPTTEAPTTEAPTTEAPTMEAPTTEASTTEAPTTEVPTTETPTTEAPTMEVPTTEAPTNDNQIPQIPVPEEDTASVIEPDEPLVPEEVLTPKEETAEQVTPSVDQKFLVFNPEPALGVSITGQKKDLIINTDSVAKDNDTKALPLTGENQDYKKEFLSLLMMILGLFLIKRKTK
ncbi:hypothetical protein ETH99_00085 [Macrococcoides caseolyticum]|nr:hypothetical protein ETH99_00085 [Macrococcus caseolyticus]